LFGWQAEFETYRKQKAAEVAALEVRLRALLTAPSSAVVEERNAGEEEEEGAVEVDEDDDDDEEEVSGEQEERRAAARRPPGVWRPPGALNPCRALGLRCDPPAMVVVPVVYLVTKQQRMRWT
jgi:hypothetical protein